MGGFLRSCVVLCLISSPAFAAVMEVQTVQSQLQQQHATWTAKDSWVNQLSPDQVKRMMGYPGKVRKDKEFTLTARIPEGTDKLDWRSKDGQNWVSPVLNQGNCGSCVAFATVGTLETQMNISQNYPWLNLRYSTDALFACGGGSCDSGWWPSEAANFLQRTGVPDEACSPYSMGATGQDISCSSICSDASSRSQKISSSNTPRNFEEVKAALRHGPLVTTLDVYADFVLYGSGIYKHTSGDYLGGHAVSLIGYNDAERYWIIRNSWGADWGENGFMRVSYDDTSGIADETWGFSLPTTDGIVAVRNLHDRDYVNGAVSFDTLSTVPGTTDLNMTITAADKSQSTLGCKSDRCAINWDTTKLADGRYEAILAATAKGKTVSSEKKYFYVVNNRPAKMEITFKPEGFDITNPIKDRVVFDIDAVTSSVPFTRIQLLVKQNGKVVYSKVAPVVLSQMTLGWRTITVPNGDYEISLVGTIDAGRLSYQAVSNTYKVRVQN